MIEPTSNWLDWAREIFSLAQAGLTYSKNEFDLERYRRLQEISAEIISSQSALEKAAVLESLSMQAGYATPKVDVRAAIFRDGKILLVQERIDDCWSLPGGWADLVELPSAMVEREVWEESGFQVKARKLLAVFDANRAVPAMWEFYHAYKLVFRCEIFGGEPAPSMETLAVDFFDPLRLPPLSTARTSQRVIDEICAHFADPSRPTTFD